MEKENPLILQYQKCSIVRNCFEFFHLLFYTYLLDGFEREKERKTT